ncbi:reverse transcriptase domain-containing protein [Tanacetum coccineum]
MRTRSQARRRRQPQVRQTSVESPNLEKPNNNQGTFNPPIVTMDDNRTMAQLLEAPTEGYKDAIVVPEITANNFEIKHGLLNLVQNKQFFGHDKKDPHAHIRYFNKITSTMKFPKVPSTSVKLMLSPFSLEGAARIWFEKEPPRSILTWDDLVSKFINKFFPPSKTTNLRNEIMRFQQKFDKTFYEAWDRFNDLLRGCPHHGFSELHQLDTFYNALNSNDQDSLKSAAGGNFLDKMPRECLKSSRASPKFVNHEARPLFQNSEEHAKPGQTLTNPKWPIYRLAFIVRDYNNRLYFRFGNSHDGNAITNPKEDLQGTRLVFQRVDGNLPMTCQKRTMEVFLDDFSVCWGILSLLPITIWKNVQYGVGKTPIMNSMRFRIVLKLKFIASALHPIYCQSDKKLLTFSKLATVDPLGDTTVQLPSLKKESSNPGFYGQIYMDATLTLFSPM